MQYTLKVRAFFFNAQTDYLPYYKNFTMTLAEDAKSVEILQEIKAQNENFAYPEEKRVFKINELVFTGEESIGEIVEKLGTELLVEPVLSYRSNHCLVINDSDFMQRFELLAPYATDEDKAYYESLYAQHYASETLKFSHEYIGDAVLLLAHRMIENGSEHKSEILAAVNDEYEGLNACEFENNLFNGEDHTATIESLSAMIDRPDPCTLLEKFSQKLSKEAQAAHAVEDVNGLGVAYYPAHETTPSQEEVFAAIEAAGAHVVRFSREKRLCGRSLIGKQNNLAYLKAATTLLDALDSGADVLIVANEADLEMFNKHFAAIQKRIGREIPLALLSFEAFKKLPQKKEVA
jgi:succinate dehydrogenase/fumarate reductase-like Fe-S protein